jgi:hypothetical protein
MNQTLVTRAQQCGVIDARLSAIAPMAEVMRIDKPRVRTPREGATFIT